MKVETDRLLASLSTFGVGGPARFFCIASSLKDLREAVVWATKERLPLLVIGNGSNLLFDDGGFDGLVILNRIRSLQREVCSSKMLLEVGSGYRLPLLSSKTASWGYGGLEFAAGIPGTVGGGIVMNAGACGKEISHVLEEVEVVYPDGSFEWRKKEKLSFGYRFSLFQKESLYISRARFALENDSQAQKKRKELVQARIATQPLTELSAGCVFRNPPNLSAGRLIDECGLKGHRNGRAEVSSIHANFIINRGGAQALEISELIDFVRFKVKEEHNIDLQQEVHYVKNF